MESLGRALAVRPASASWDAMRELYLRAQGPGEEEGLAVALSASATVEHVDALVTLLDEHSKGESRIHFLRAIQRLGGSLGANVLKSRVDDPLFGKEATALLKPNRRK